MNSARATPADDSRAPHEHGVTSKEQLDAWLDAALADTFPASDPVASPPSNSAPVQSGDLDRSADRSGAS
jgi:hypothetical protein